MSSNVASGPGYNPNLYGKEPTRHNIELPQDKYADINGVQVRTITVLIDTCRSAGMDPEQAILEMIKALQSPNMHPEEAIRQVIEDIHEEVQQTA